jgi:hypothetical protein
MTGVVTQFGFPGDNVKNLEAVIDFINSFSEVLSFTVVTGGVEVLIPHDLEVIPRQVFPVIKEGDTVSFANVYAGTTAWTKSEVYLSASLPGTYNVILRR